MARLIIPQDVNDVLSYCPSTGDIRWKVHLNKRITKGSVAGTILKGYRKIRCRGTIYFAHRLAWFLHYGEQPPEILDHINHNRDDNRIANLRAVTSVGSNINKSGARGVSWNKGYDGRKGFWQAQISKQYLYNGPDLFEAWCQRKSAENKYWGNLANQRNNGN